MPKVTRKETSGPLQEAVGMVVDDEQLPAKPNFSALSAQEQAGGKVEFRRVRCPAATAACRQNTLSHARCLHGAESHEVVCSSAGM
jgi:hypothetical protein